MTLAVYIAAPFSSGPDLARRIPGRLAAVGATCTSSWLEMAAAGPEDFARFSVEEIRCFATQNDADLEDSDVVLLIDPDRRGRETYAEAAKALLAEMPIVWFAPPTLSAWQAGVVRVDGLDQAIAVLARMAEAHADGARGLLLAHLCAGVAA